MGELHLLRPWWLLAVPVGLALLHLAWRAGAPEGDGWICTLSEIDTVELEALMSEEEYEALSSGEEDEEG